MSRHSRTLGASLGVVMMLVTADHGGIRRLPFAGPPVPMPAPDSLASMYDVGGIPVIQRRSLSGQVVAAKVYLLGGSRQVNASNAGIEAVLLGASEYGTKNYPGLAVRDAESLTGSEVSVGVEPDWATIGFVGLAEDFDSTWAVVADRLIHPTLDSAAVAIAKRRALAAVDDRTNGPDGMVGQMAESLAFAGHPYQIPTGGTVTSITSLTPAMVRDYEATQVVGSRLLVVVAGNVTRAQVEGAVQRTLATLPQGAYKWTLPEPWKSAAPAIAVKRQQLPTNYIVGYFGGPQGSGNDAMAFQAGLGYITSLIEGPMRDSGLTYGAGAGYINRGAAGGMITLTTPSPDRALKIIDHAIAFLSDAKTYGSGSAYFNRQTGGSTDRYLSRMERSEQQVDNLADSYLYHGDFRYLENIDQQVNQVSPSDMGRALRAYVKNIQWAYLGDTTKVPRELMTKY